MNFDSLSDVSPASRHWCIRVRVARMWDYCGTRDGQPPIHVDLVLIDEEGNAMYAEIPGSEAKKFKELIQEHEVYSLKKFLVAPSKPAYKPFPAKYMIKFTPWTAVTPHVDVPETFPMYVYNLVPFCDLPSRVGAQDIFTDVVGQIVGVSKLAQVRISTNTSDTAKRVITLRDDRNTEVKLVLWGQRATEFEAQLVYDNGQTSAVVGVFVGLLMKSYNNDETLSGGSACRWYLNEDIPEIDYFFERLGDNFQKIKWISNGTENFAAPRNRGNLPHKTVAELRDMDPWETENTDFLCTVTIASVTPDQPWWFQSCSKCHRSATSYGSEYRCTGGCVSTKAYPKYRLCLMGTDGTGTAEFVFFNRVAQQLVGKTVMSLLKSSGVPREIAATVTQKYTLAVSVTQKSLSQRNISFQVNAIETFFGRQNSIPHDTRLPAIMPVSSATPSSLDLVGVEHHSSSLSASNIPSLPIPAADLPKHQHTIRVPLRSAKRKEPEESAGTVNVDKDAGSMAGSVIGAEADGSVIGAGADGTGAGIQFPSEVDTNTDKGNASSLAQNEHVGLKDEGKDDPKKRKLLTDVPSEDLPAASGTTLTGGKKGKQ